ncbi:hypothetical protein C8J36_12214 [Rhizobium sp. PP-F2F-G48]|uniref:hypothetical protein n=1 Tax=Rhizobium sp. PP-F2F-G48 TaxID=2135651 RepID=UPI00104A7BF6|nr:hypothetical protein [Rhizobium sp. PP-F2F-G48]TCM45374.1 hypothetical protein C8J36_12214 [Rhizobium sp. PP-F2F-G48]
MPRKTEDAHNQEQRERQQKLRDRDKQARRPDRDDVARVALYWLISRTIQKRQFEELDKFRDQIVSMLADQGFDERASDVVFESLVEKYRTGSPFRRKVHLLHPNVPDLDI